MDQLFINERELPPTPSASAQLLDSARNPDGLSVQQGKKAVVPTVSSRGQEDLQSWLGNEDTIHGRPQQESSRSVERISLQQGKSTEPLPLPSQEETLQPWLGTELTRERQQLDQEEIAAREVYEPPTYTEAEILSQGSSPSQQVAASQATSVESSSRLQESLNVSNAQSQSTLDIYDNDSERGISRNASPSIDASAEPSDVINRPVVPRRYSRPSRPYSGYPGNTNRESPTPSENAGRSSGSLPSQIFRGPLPQPEVVVPRWQPDAEVTFCPICRTQFSFFVRKHHCRKCGRVVCNACSPHRITIPHQYIVHPPEDPNMSATRPSVDPVRARSSTLVASLGGGERVRLCNPCVPDPNIAPPQTRSDGQPIQSQGHGRSASTVPYTLSRRGDLDIPNYRQPQRDSSLSTEARHNRSLAWAVSGQAQQQQSSSSYSHRDELLLRPELEARSRSSTVGSARGSPHSNTSYSRQETQGAYSRPYNPSNPRSEINLSRPLPDTPHQQHRTTQRRAIREDDQCWVCFHELPSRDLPNFQDLRDAHVRNCLENATRRSSPAASRAPPTIAPIAARPPPSFPYPSADSRPQAPPAVAAPSTPESRMQARERQHAAIVYGQQQSSTSASSSSASPMSRVIPYIASEKDGIDDAECMVCLEDFEVGQEMGRLECFCRFHLKCIKGWFEKKPGKCPVHGVDN